MSVLRPNTRLWQRPQAACCRLWLLFWHSNCFYLTSVVMEFQYFLQRMSPKNSRAEKKSLAQSKGKQIMVKRLSLSIRHWTSGQPNRILCHVLLYWGFVLSEFLSGRRFLSDAVIKSALSAPHADYLRHIEFSTKSNLKQWKNHFRDGNYYRAVNRLTLNRGFCGAHHSITC